MASRLRVPLTAAARALALALAIIVVTAMTAGWLYWLRADVAGWPGPLVRDVLPLDELPGHDRIPLLVCVVAFGISGLGLGLAARALGLSRLAAGLSLAAGVGVWLFLIDAVCLFIVRQEPSSAAIRSAAGLQPMYLEAALAGAGGALLGRDIPGGRAHMIARSLAWIVALAGLIDLVSALFPHPGPALGLLERLGPGRVSPVAHALIVPVGALLLVGSRGLGRRSRRAWELSAVLLGVSAALQLLRGPDYAAAVFAGLAAVALVARRRDFPFRGDPAAESSALLRLGGLLTLAAGYGLAAIWTHRMLAGLPFGLYPALRDTLRAMAGLSPRGEQFPPVHFAGWFTFSVLSIVVIGVIWAAQVWIRPWRQRLFPMAGERDRAAQIVRQWGSDTLAPFALRADKDWLIVGQTLIAFRVVRGLALLSGDPVGPPGEAGQAVDEFLAYARARGWHVAVLGASDRLLPAYRDRGLHPVYHGSEAVIDVGGFSLDGRPMRTVRQAVHRLDRYGYRTEVAAAGEVTPELRAELTAVEGQWLHGVRKGFTMELDDLFRLGGDDAVFVIGRDPCGQVAGFLHLAVCAAGRSLSLSSMPRRPQTPNGFNAWLIAAAVSWARDHGFGQVSLNFSPFADLLAAGSALTTAQRLERGALLKLKGALALQMDNLLRFNRQFCPGWRPRYVVVEHRADLPRVALAAMAAEGYLPHADLVRGADWAAEQAEPAAPGEPGDRPGPEAPGAEPVTTPGTSQAPARPAAGPRGRL